MGPFKFHLCSTRNDVLSSTVRDGIQFVPALFDGMKKYKNIPVLYLELEYSKTNDYTTHRKRIIE